jgi:hypothetical protein
MKNVCKLLILLVLLASIKPATGKKAETRFKPGDWFECEMEFVNDVPVFHNHWANNDSVGASNKDFTGIFQYYLVLRFQLQETVADSIEIWNYKIIRNRMLSRMNPSERNRYKLNGHCYDSWYPDYYIDVPDSLKQDFTGSIKLVNNVIQEHISDPNEFNKSQNTSMKVLFSITEDGRTFYSSKFLGISLRLRDNAENMLKIIFAARKLDNKATASYGKSVSQVKYFGNDSVFFSISDEDFNNNYTAYLLPNGLAYAFKDKYKQKVMAITNASFALPNKAIVSINDKRSKKEKQKKYFDNIELRFGNNAHIITQNVKTENNVSNYSFELKCGVELTFWHLDSNHSIFIQPGDSVQITIQDDINNPVTISGIKHYLDYLKVLNGTKEQIEAASLSPECKAYLCLKNSIQFTLSKLYSSPDTKEYQQSMVDFYFLKSFHYKGLFELGNVGTVIGIGNNEHQSRIYASGAPFYTNFTYKYYNALSNFSHFPLYAQLYETLNYSIKLDKESYYSEFFTNCGDTLITNKLSDWFNKVKSVQVGRTLPFTKLLIENGQKVDIMPQKGKFGLLYLGVEPKEKDWDYLKSKFKNELSTDVQYVLYRINIDNQIKMNNSMNVLSLAKVDSLELFGHPSMKETLYKYIYERSESVIILYDDKGKIWYNTAYSHNSIDNNNEKYITGIQNAIQQAKTKPVSKSKSILLIILLSVIGSVTITLLFYRIRIARLKKKNAREKLIQELKLKSVQSQLNPHFLFNALNSIQVLVKSGDVKQADNYLVGFSELLRNVLQNADKRLVPLSEELKMVNRYCELEKLRLDFDCELKTDTQTNLDLIEVPYMLFQPIIENAIKHGVAKANGRGKLKIEISEKNSELNICVSDNGPGFDSVPLEVLKERGRGLKLTLEKLQSIYGADANFVILTANPGTTVSITLKIG